jgi:peptidoglycan/xylan/chitin deacetylase (PgdA/CDA1 family)
MMLSRRNRLGSGHSPIRSEGAGGAAIAAGVSGISFKLAGLLSASRLAILIFHRVRADVDPLFAQEPDAEHFDRLMELVAQNFNVLRLSDVPTLLCLKKLPRRALVITFDDGYADNAEVALPILKRHGLTATFFVASGFLDGKRMWNDSVIECVRRTERDALDLSELELGYMTLGSLVERRACIDALLPRLKYLDANGRAKALESLQRATGVDSLPSDLMMRSDQVRELHRSGMEIGAHTVSHPILTTLSGHDAEREVADSRDQLQEITRAPVTAFAYPNGKPKRDYDRSHVELVKRLGFRVAVSTASGAASAGDDLFELPRFTPWNRSLSAWSIRLLLNQRSARYERA